MPFVPPRDPDYILNAISDSAALVFGIMYAAVWYFIRTGGLHACLALMFDPQHLALSADARRDLRAHIMSSAVPTILFLWVFIYAALLYFNIDHFGLKWVAVTAIINLYCTFCVFSAIYVFPLVAWAHFFTLQRHIEFFTDISKQSALLKRIRLESSTAATSFSRLAPLPATPMDDKDSNPLDPLDVALHVVAHNRGHLAETSAALAWPVTIPCGGLLLHVALMITGAANQIASNTKPAQATFFFSAFFLIVSVTLLSFVARISAQHANSLWQLRRHGTAHLLETLPQHAWRLQLLVSTVEDGNFTVFNYGITFATCATLFSVFGSVIAYMVSVAVAHHN